MQCFEANSQNSPVYVRALTNTCPAHADVSAGCSTHEVPTIQRVFPASPRGCDSGRSYSNSTLSCGEEHRCTHAHETLCHLGLIPPSRTAVAGAFMCGMPSEWPYVLRQKVNYRELRPALHNSGANAGAALWSEAY